MIIPRRFLRAAACAGATLVIAACGSSPDSLTAPPSSPGYSLSVSGDDRATLSGIALADMLPNAYSETLGSGPTSSIDVVLITLAQRVPSRPQVSIGLLGKVTTGVWHVRVTGAGTLGSAPELYARYLVPGTDGSRREYPATTGTLTITAVSPLIQGTFALHASRVIPVPADYREGTEITTGAASLDFAGSFAVAPREPIR